MELKVNLPSPYEDGTDIKQFLALMRVALKAMEKTYEEVIKDLTPEDTKSVFVRFNNTFMQEKKVKVLEEELDPDYSKTQEVWLEITTL